MRQNADVRSTRSVLSLVYLWTECDCWGSAGRQIKAVDWLTDVRRASCSGDVRNDERHLSIVIVEMFRRHHNETSVPSVRSSQLRRYVWMCDRFLLSRLRSASVSPSLLSPAVCVLRCRHRQPMMTARWTIIAELLVGSQKFAENRAKYRLAVLSDNEEQQQQ